MAKFWEKFKSKNEVEDEETYILEKVLGEELEADDFIIDKDEKEIKEWKNKYANYVFKDKDTEIYLNILDRLEKELIENREEIIELEEKKIRIDKVILQKNKKVGKIIKEYNTLVSISNELDNINAIENHYLKKEFKPKTYKTKNEEVKPIFEIEKIRKKQKEMEGKKERREL